MAPRYFPPVADTLIASIECKNISISAAPIVFGVDRTPGFSGWQQEQWWTHCGDAAQFIGRAGRKELKALGPQAIAAIQESAGMSDSPEWDEFWTRSTKKVRQ